MKYSFLHERKGMAVPFEKHEEMSKVISNFMLRHILLNLLEEQDWKQYHAVHDWLWNILSNKLKGGCVTNHIS